MIAGSDGQPRTFALQGNAFVALADKARSMSDGRLVAAEVIGFAAALAIFAWAPRTLEVLFLATAVGSLGLWGVTDHALGAHRMAAPLRVALTSFRFLTAAVGIAAAVSAGYALVGRLMGVFIL